MSSSSNPIVTLAGHAFHAHNVTEALDAASITASGLGYLYRRTREVSYCEAKYGGIFFGAVTAQPEAHFPERGSVFTTPFIMWCGLHMITCWRHDSSLLHVLSALFVVNGASSFLAHYTGITAWHNVDSKSMLLAVWLGCSFLLSELLSNAFERLCPGACGKTRTILTPLSWLVPMTAYFWLTETNGTVSSTEEMGHKIGAIGTAVPLCACVAIGFVHVCSGWGRSEAIGERSYIIARNRFVLGVCIAAVGAVAWTVTENMCDRTDAVGMAFRWFPGHAIWHVTLAWGLTMALLFACVLRADSFRTKVYIRVDQSCYFLILPKLNFDAARGIVQPVEPQTPDHTRPRREHLLVRGLSFFRSSAQLVQSTMALSSKRTAAAAGGGGAAPRLAAKERQPNAVGRQIV
jgi:hypothetical protein